MPPPERSKSARSVPAAVMMKASSVVDDLACPVCGGPLAPAEDGKELACAQDHGPWPVREGLPVLYDGAVEHAGRWESTYPETKGKGPLARFRSRNEHWGIPRLLGNMLDRAGPPLRILDTGCGGGWAFLSRFGNVTGIDRNPDALHAASAVYDRIVCAALPRIPFADSSFDVVTHVWVAEHLEEPAFVEFLGEVRRVLRPGGHTIFFADLYSDKPLMRWARDRPDLYRRYHVDAVGHRGLRTLAQTHRLLQQAGFLKVETVPINKSSLLQPVTALWMFDNELGRESRLLRAYVAFCRAVRRSHWVHRAVYSLLMEYHRWVNRRLPDSYASSAGFDWMAPAHGTERDLRATPHRLHHARTAP